MAPWGTASPRARQKREGKNSDLSPLRHPVSCQHSPLAGASWGQRATSLGMCSVESTFLGPRAGQERHTGVQGTYGTMDSEHSQSWPGCSPGCAAHLTYSFQQLALPCSASSFRRENVAPGHCVSEHAASIARVRRKILGATQLLPNSKRSCQHKPTASWGGRYFWALSRHHVAHPEAHSKLYLDSWEGWAHLWAHPIGLGALGR